MTDFIRRQRRPFRARHWGVVLLGVLLAAGCEQQQPPQEEIVRPVRYMKVQPTGEKQRRVFPGSSRDSAATRISFRVSGRIAQLNMKVGDRVKAGQVIARLDDQDFRLQVSQAAASLEQARASQRNAASVLERVRGLYENNNASRNELDAARANAEAADASVQTILNQLRLARRQLGYAELSAPADCDVATVDVEVNENVAAGQPLGLLGCGGQTEVKVVVPGSTISLIRQGDSVKVRFPAIENVVFPGTVTEVGVAATEIGTTFPVIVRINEEPVPLRSGLAGEVEFSLGTSDGRERILVPLSAVGGDLNGRFVYVVQPGAERRGTVARRVVEVGELSDAGMEITGGLEAGDLVVTAGVSQLKDGQPVRLLENLESGS